MENDHDRLIPRSREKLRQPERQAQIPLHKRRSPNSTPDVQAPAR